MESLPQAIRLRSSPKFQTVTSVRQAVNKFFNQEQTDAEAAPPPEKKARKWADKLWPPDPSEDLLQRLGGETENATFQADNSELPKPETTKNM